MKALTGVRFFDDRYGGTYSSRCTALCGPSGAGKSAIGLQFIAQGVRQGERGLILSAQPAADVVIYASAFGPEVQQAVESGELVILEYADYVPGRDREENLMLPPDGFIQLQEIIDSNAIQRVVLDTALPWVMPPSLDMMAEHVFSFVRAFERLRCTTLLTMPKAVSPTASKLKATLDDIVPVSISLSMEPGSGQHRWAVTKYLGETRIEPPVPFVLQVGIGAVKGTEPAETPAPARAPEPVHAPEQVALEAPAPTPAPAAVGAAAPQPTGRVRFANVLLSNEDRSERAPTRGFRFGMTVT